MSNKQSWLSHLGFLLLFVATLALGCSPAASTRGEGTGKAEVVIKSGQALGLSAAVVRVSLTISGPGIAAPIVNDLVAAQGGWHGTVTGIPAGEGRTFHADAFDAAAVLLYVGEVSPVTISPDATAVVAILLQQATPPPTLANRAPIIDGIVASAKTVEPGAAVSLRVVAHDPDPSDELTYAWSATNGAFDSAASTTTTWTAPATEGTVTLTIEVNDPSGSRAAMNFDITVVARGAADVSTTFNTWPVVSLVSAIPTRIDVGESTSLSVSATDAESDPLTYAWSSSCEGTFSNATAMEPSFTLGSLPAEGACTLSVVVDDGMGGHATGSIGVAAGPAAPVDFPPVIDQAFQSLASVAAAESVVLRVVAHDPNLTAVTFSWSADAGTIGDPTNADGESQVTWTAPTPFTTAHVTATVTDGTGSTTTRVFTVTSTTVACTNCSFETGDLTGWTVTDTANAHVNVSGGGEDGSYALRNDFDGVAGTISVSQEMTIDGPVLAFFYDAWWDNMGLPRTFSVRIEPVGGGTPLAETLVLSAEGMMMGSATGTGMVDVSAFQGQLRRVTFFWTIPETYTGPGDFLLDHVRFVTPS